MKFELVIGLETHVELNTKSKIFCSCGGHSEANEPNDCVCPACSGMPGMLPVMNKRVVELAEAFRDKHGYNFVGEDQLMLASAAAYNLKTNVYVADGQLRITPGESARDFALYDEAYQSACGIRIRFSEKFDTDKISSSASVQKWQDGALYVSLDKPISIDFRGKSAASPIVSVNIPAEISLSENTATLNFLDDGMMQVKVRGLASTDCKGWNTETANNITTFTKFGAAETLEIKY